MRTNNNNGTIDLVPLTLNVVNLQGLKLICRKTSERYERNPSKEKKKMSQMQSPDIKNRDFRSNKIYFKKKKERDDQHYFSDFKIKYGIEISCLPTNAATNNNIEQEQQHQRPPTTFIINSNSDSQNHPLKPLTHAKEQAIYDKQSYRIDNIKNVEQRKGNSEKMDEKRHASTKMEKRKTPNLIKFSFSNKNYKKVHIPDTKINLPQPDNQLEGWATAQSPNVYQIDKKLDITSYAQPDYEETRNYFSERKKSKEENRYFSRIKRPKVLTKS